MSYTQFHRWLFPGDPVIEQNPLEADASADEILAEVARRTGISVKWLQKSTREVLEGLAGLGCLWFLHGASGQAQGEEPIPQWVSLVIDFACFHTKNLLDEKRRGVIDVTGSTQLVNWQKGNFTVFKRYANRKSSEQTFKIGKFIDGYIKAGNGNERQRLAMHHDLKWRAKADMFDWWVSCHPYDVLTMSYGRPWPSCMKPGGLFEYGPLTDMAAGAAIVWFKPVGSDAPSGRIILRPYLERDGTPAIATGGRAYGRCPATGIEDLRNLLRARLRGVAINRIRICPLGEDGRALTRAIYSDTDNVAGGCEQSVDEYEDAYEALGDADWPPTPKDVVASLAVTTRATAGLKYRDDDNEDSEAVVEEAYNEALGELLTDCLDGIVAFFDEQSGEQARNLEVYKALSDPRLMLRYANDLVEAQLTSEFADECYAGLGGERPPDYVYDDIAAQLKEALYQELRPEMQDYAMVTYSKTALDNPTVVSARLLIRQLVAEVTPLELYTDSKWLFHREGEMEWVEGKAIDDDTGKEITAVLIMPDWCVDAVPEIVDGAIHIERQASVDGWVTDGIRSVFESLQY